VATTTIHYRTLPGTRAAVGRVGNHSVIADRPHGKFGGMGLGFNGGELLAAAIGGCLCNDMQAIAEEMDLAIDDLQVSVEVAFTGDPVRASGARVAVRCLLADGSDPAELITRAEAATTIGNSLPVGIPLRFDNS
jgi:organic hydroperoxide reductase OsmC/OhrA